jgi:hypothetical protein
MSVFSSLLVWPYPALHHKSFPQFRTDAVKREAVSQHLDAKARLIGPWWTRDVAAILRDRLGGLLHPRPKTRWLDHYGHIKASRHQRLAIVDLTMHSHFMFH